MRITENTRFPHPILCEYTGDYKSGRFEFNVKNVQEDIKGSQVSIDYEVKISEDTIKKLIEEKKAQVGIFVVCSDTYFSEYLAVDCSETRINFPPGTLNDRVEIKPIITTIENIEKFSNDNWHEEFREQQFNLSKNEIIAVGEETTLIVGREKLAPMDSIFTLSKDDSLENGEISVVTETDKITILACSETCTKINTLRGNRAGQAVLLNAVYLPVIMEVLSSMKESPDVMEDKRWFQIFSAKCRQAGINLEAPDILSDAQKLLKSPFTKIENCKELYE